MKALFLQLARYGDILMSYPAIAAWHRRHPGCEIHILVRERFHQAAEVFGDWVTVKVLPTAFVLEPVLELDDEVAALKRLTGLVDSWRAEDYTHIFNFTYSPLSSELVAAIRGPSTLVGGYDRTEDGYLAIPDDVSAYFHAQSGPDRAGRLHLVDVFAAMTGSELLATDERLPATDRLVGRPEFDILKPPYVVFHAGASDPRKAYDPVLFRRYLDQFQREAGSNAPSMVLVGGREETQLASEILGQAELAQVVNLVGQTSLRDLFSVVAGADLVVGADSLLIHVADLCGVRSLNLSIGPVCFWETGPRVKGSRILLPSQDLPLAAERVAEETRALWAGELAVGWVWERTGELPTGYRSNTAALAQDLCWDFIKAIYLGEPFPEVHDPIILKGLRSLQELALVAIEILSRPTSAEILSRLDETRAAIGVCVPELRPIIAWFETELIRIPPGDVEKVQSATLACYQNLARLTMVYFGGDEDADNCVEQAGP